MSRLVLLDTGPLGLATNPRESEQTRRCNEWLFGLLAAGMRVLVPALADYELRRELLRAGKTRGVQRLDALAEAMGYLPIGDDVWKLAAELWAQARRGGYPTAADPALDGDVILAAQARLAAEADGLEVVVATDNPEHLARFVPAERWEAIA